MKLQVQWRFFLPAKTPEKAHRVLARLAQAIGQGTSVVECEKYWKDKALFRGIVTSPISAQAISESVLETFQVCSRLAGRWNVVPPQIYEGDYWDFSGSADADTIIIPGVAYIDFVVGNLPAPQTQAVSGHEQVGS